jgi:fructose-bisphosphate aldolase/2-amino-3,7-dideoxy-D-threo-hept-6-ulosonate synthase
MQEHEWSAQLSRFPSNRILRIVDTPEKKTVIVPIDDSLIGGPSRRLANMTVTLHEIVGGGPTAILGFPGQFERFARALADPRIGRIMNLTASAAGPHHTRKVQVHSVEHALRLGCDAVAAHINLTSHHEPEMVESLGGIVEAAQREGVPTVAIIYPRKTKPDGSDDNYESLRISDSVAYAQLIGRCVRLAADLGAAMVKTQYTGDPVSFSRVCDETPEVPVVVAGGPLCPEEEVLARVRDLAASSAAGISFGRNIYNRENICKFLQAVRAALEGR